MITTKKPYDENQERSYHIRIAILITGFSILRLAVASLTSLGNDEVYYFTYAVQPDWNHFDHPPLVGIFIRLFTIDLRWVNEVTLRMPALAGAALNTFLIARCARKIAGTQTGLTAALFYNINIYTSIISGTFILPDSIQLTFWLLAVQTALTAISAENVKSQRVNFLLFGVWTGLAIMCKVHGIFLWFGLAGFIILRKTNWLKDPILYLACAITLLIASPILIWNINNDFISWQFHSERVEINQGIQLKPLLVNLVGQILYFNPILFVLAIWSLIGIKKQWYTIQSDQLRLLLWMACPIIAATITVSLFRPTLPHWSGPGYIAIILLSAIFVSDQKLERKQIFQKFTNASLALILLVFVAGLMMILHFPGTLSEKSVPQTGRGDVTLDMYRWEELRDRFEVLRTEDIAQNRMSASAPIVVHKWFPGGHIYYHVAYPLQIPLRAIGNLLDLHQFQWMNKRATDFSVGSDAYYITPSNNFTDPSAIFSGHFNSIELAEIIPQKRGGKIARYWYIYRLKGAILPF